MSNSSQKSRNNKTKAQLAEELAEVQTNFEQKSSELAECEKQLQQTEDEIKELKKLQVKLEAVEEDLEVVEQLRYDNSELRKKLAEVEKNAASEIDEKTRNLRESERQEQNLQEKIKNLEKTVTEYESKLPQEATGSDLPSSKATFLIHLYPRQGQFQGRIEHPLSRDKKVFSGLDQTIITEFIAKYLPQLAEETPAVVADKKTAKADENGSGGSSKMETQKEPEVLQEIKFQQQKKTLEPGHPLRAHRPFTLFARLHLPVMPTSDNLDIDTNTYDVKVIAADANKKNVIARNGIANMLSAGVTDYENRINMVGLPPGNYLLRVHTFAAFARIEAKKDVKVVVE